MLQLDNQTSFAASRAILLDGRGAQIWTVIVKATFDLDPARGCPLAAEQEPVCTAPVFAGEPGASSLLRDTEMVAEHPGTDVTVNGVAHAPEGRPVRELDASVAVSDLRSTVRVSGDRRWQKGLLGLRRSEPEPFTSMPIGWERAFGGRDGDASVAENPIGRGFAARPEALADRPLPNVEHPGALIDDPAARPPPAGFGAIPAAWSPRRERAGTFDERWRTTRAPLWPDDYDPAFHRSAPAALWSERHLIGGEEVTLTNLSAAPVLSFRLPRVEVVVYTWIQRRRIRQRVRLDRVILEPEARRVLLVWRSTLDCGPDARRVARSLITTKRVLR